MDALNVLPSFLKSSSPITKSLGTCAWTLGVIFDPALKFDKQINSGVKSAFFCQFRMIAKI